VIAQFFVFRELDWAEISTLIFVIDPTYKFAEDSFASSWIN